MPASGPISEGQRLALLNRLCEVLGEEEASTLMDSLPPVYWEQLATKSDLAASEQRLGNEMRSGFAKVYGELNSFRAETAAEFKNIRAETAAEFKSVRSEMALQFARQTRTMVFTMLGLAVPVLGAILAVGLS